MTTVPPLMPERVVLSWLPLAWPMPALAPLMPLLLVLGSLP
jgi:hypothetical protein